MDPDERIAELTKELAGARLALETAAEVLDGVERRGTARIMRGYVARIDELIGDAQPDDPAPPVPVVTVRDDEQARRNCWDRQGWRQRCGYHQCRAANRCVGPICKIERTDGGPALPAIVS